MAYNFHHENYNTYYHTESPDKLFYRADVYEPDAQTDLAIDFIQRAVQRPQPFALYVSWGPPHDPWIPHQQHNLASEPGYDAALEGFRRMLQQRMAALHDTFAPSTWYRDHWTDGHRNITRLATSDFGV